MRAVYFNCVRLRHRLGPTYIEAWKRGEEWTFVFPRDHKCELPKADVDRLWELYAPKDLPEPQGTWLRDWRNLRNLIAGRRDEQGSGAGANPGGA